MTWRAAADFRLALHVQQYGDYNRAATLYRRVLESIPDHVSALHNLAVIELRHHRYMESLNLTDRLLRNSRDRVDGDRWPELEYSLRYNRALAQTLASQNGAALNSGKFLVRHVLHRLDAHAQPSSRDLLGRRRGAAIDQDELKLLERIEFSAIALLADIVLRRHNSDDVWMQAADSTLAPSQKLPSRGELLEGLADIRPAWAFAAESYVRGHAITDVRAHYNLACYRSRIRQAVRNDDARTALCDRLLFAALEDLDTALVDETLVAWAAKDPALASIRRYDAWEAFLGFQQEQVLAGRVSARESADWAAGL